MVLAMVAFDRPHTISFSAPLQLCLFCTVNETLSLISHKKLSYRRGTERRAMIVNSCYVSQGMGDKKVSNNECDLQGHSKALAMVPFNRLHMISY